jgi:hypothetical protein
VDQTLGFTLACDPASHQGEQSRPDPVHRPTLLLQTERMEAALAFIGIEYTTQVRSGKFHQFLRV